MGENTPPDNGSGGATPDDQYWPPFGRPATPPPGHTTPSSHPTTQRPDPHADTAPLPAGPWDRPDPWTPRGPGFDTQPPGSPTGPAPVWGPPSGPPAPTYPPFSAPAAGSSSFAGRPRPSRLGRVVLLAATTALLVGGAAGYGGSMLAARTGADSPNPTSAGPSPVDPGASGSASPLPAPPPRADTVEVAKRVLPGTVMIQTGSSTGSGFVLDTAGRIMTNNHVVAGAADGDRIRVVFSDGRRQNATLVGRSPSYDLAVIKVRAAKRLQPLPFGDSEAIEVGQPVIAVGAPLGLPGTVTQGIVSAQDRPVVVGGGSDADAPTAYINAIQTDAPINPGNSGGPLIDDQARVIGVNSAILTLGQSRGQAGSIGLGFAIPINQAMEIGQLLVRDGKATYPVIGANVAEEAGDEGVRLTEVESRGPAADAGLRKDDVITTIDGKPVSDIQQLIVTIRTHRPGERVRLGFQRGGSKDSTSVTLGSKEG